MIEQHQGSVHTTEDQVPYNRGCQRQAAKWASPKHSTSKRPFPHHVKKWTRLQVANLWSYRAARRRVMAALHHQACWCNIYAGTSTCEVTLSLAMSPDSDVPLRAGFIGDHLQNLEMERI